MSAWVAVEDALRAWVSAVSFDVRVLLAVCRLAVDWVKFCAAWLAAAFALSSAV